MATSKSVVYGIFPTRGAVETCVDRLRLEGFGSSEVSVLFSSPESTSEFAHENATKAPEGAATGAVSGATVGGVLGWLAGIGSLAIPGVGPFIAAGPIMGALAGMGVGGAVGGLSGALIGLGIPEYEARRFEGRVKDGGILLSVEAASSESADRAKKILEETGAEDISTKSEASVDDDSRARDNSHPRHI